MRACVRACVRVCVCTLALTDGALPRFRPLIPFTKCVCASAHAQVRKGWFETFFFICEWVCVGVWVCGCDSETVRRHTKVLADGERYLGKPKLQLALSTSHLLSVAYRLLLPAGQTCTGLE